MGVLGATPNTAVVALNFVRPRAPTVTDDAAAGYTIGAHWTDPTTQRVWICGSAAAGAAVWVEVVGSTSPPPVSAFLTDGVHVFSFGSTVFTDTTRYPFISILTLAPQQNTNRQAWQTWAAAQAPPKGRLLFYKTLTETASAFGITNFASVATMAAVEQTKRFDGTSVIPAEEVKYHDANFPSDRWQLYDGSGNPLYYGSFSQSWLVDPSSASFKALALQYLRGQIIAQGWDGVYFDNILVSSATLPASFPFYRKDSSGSLVVAFADYNAWAAGIVSGLQGVAAQLIADGFYVACNTHWFISGQAASNTGAAENAWWALVGPNVSQMISEYSTTVPQGIRRSTDDVAWYDFWLPFTSGLYATAVAAGCGMGFGVGEGFTGADARYAVASMRVVATGLVDSSSTIFASSWDDAVHKIAWGTKVGGLLQSGAIRAQRWTGGWAVVNTTRTGQQQATFTDPVTGLPRTFTIAAVDSYVGA